MYKTDRGDWKRVSRTETAEKPDGQTLVSWVVPGNEGNASVALCYPYGVEESELLLKKIGARFSRQYIGVTSAGRPIPRLSNSHGSPGSSRPGIYCTARQHSGETPGSWVLDGFLREIADAGELAPLVWVVPFVDLDGVIAGRYGKDSFPYDFNRAWGSRLFPGKIRILKGKEPMRYEVKCIQSDMVRWSQRCRPALQIDFHAPSLFESEGIYCFINSFEEGLTPNAPHTPWIEAFRLALEAQKTAVKNNFARDGNYLSRWNTARVGDFASEALRIPNFSFETPYNRAGGRVLAIKDYRDAGRRIARATIDVARTK